MDRENIINQDIEFQKDGHIYRVNGIEVPSVTQILKDVGLINERFYGTPDHRIKGQIVHELTAMIDKEYVTLEDLREDGYEPYMGYIEAWKKYKADVQAKFFDIEKHVYHPKYQYAGTLDRLGTVHNIVTIIDIKTGQPDKWHGAQLIGYAMAEDTQPELEKDLQAVYLKEDGKYLVKEYGNTRDRNLWFSALNIYKAKH